MANNMANFIPNFVVSKENKEVLWNVLYNNKLFHAIPETNFNNIQSIFEKTIVQSLNENREIFNNENNSDPKNSIITMNKIILQNIIVNINNYKKALLTPIEIKETLKLEKLEEFDKELSAKKESFNELITLKKPDVIDFSDIKEDDPLTTNNMNELLEKIQKERAITFPILASVDLNTRLVIEDEDLGVEADSQFHMTNSAKNIKKDDTIHDLHTKLDNMSSQLAQLIANQALIMEKLNKLNS